MKTVLRITAIALSVLFCACAPTETQNSQSEISSQETSSLEESSKETSSVDDSLLYADDGFYKIQEAAKIIKTGRDDSKLFIEGVAGYEINGGIYYVDAETMVRLTKTPVRGDGSIMLLGWSDLSIGYGDHPDQFKAAAVEKLHDPVYMSMYLPSEGTCFLKTLIHGYNIFPANEKYKNVVSLGAIYKNYDYELPDDAEFTICVGKSQLLMRTTKSDGWFVADEQPYPQLQTYLYYLPWQLESEIGIFPIAANRITYYDDHVEIRLKGAELNATIAKKVNDEVKECVIHFWGEFIEFDSLGVTGDEVLGVLSSFDVWVKEPEYANHFVIGVGADWRDANGTINMAYESLKYTLTNEPRPAFAHSVSPSVYDEVMDVEFVKEQLGLE